MVPSSRSSQRVIASAIRRQHNLIVRPKCAGAELVQLEDLGEAMLERVRAAAFLILTTSAENHPAWVAVSEYVSDFARRLRQGTGADPSASGATRVSGSLNFKRKYAPDFPTVSLLQTIPGFTVMPVELDALGLVAVPGCNSVIRPGRGSSPRGTKRWPSYELCLRNAPSAHHSDRADVSRADFTFCLLAIDWGWSLMDTYQRLLEMSRKARENGRRIRLSHGATRRRRSQSVNRRSLNTVQARGKNNVR